MQPKDTTDKNVNSDIQMIKASIIGVTGYTGLEVLRLLLAPF